MPLEAAGVMTRVHSKHVVKVDPLWGEEDPAREGTEVFTWESSP